MNLRDAFHATRGDDWDEAASPTADAIITMRVADLPFPPIGSVERVCSMCDAPVVISASTLATFKGKPLPPIWCAPCGLNAVRRGGRA